MWSRHKPVALCCHSNDDFILTDSLQWITTWRRLSWGHTWSRPTLKSFRTQVECYRCFISLNRFMWSEGCCCCFHGDSSQTLRSTCGVDQTNLGIRALASSAASGHRFAKLASSNLWSFFCRRRLNGSRGGEPSEPARRVRQAPGRAVPANGRDGLSVLEAAEPSRVVERLHEDLGQLLLILRALVLLLPVLQQHVDLRVQQRLRVLKLWRRESSVNMNNTTHICTPGLTHGSLDVA